MRHRILGFVALATLGVAAPARAQEHGAAPAAQPTTITGTVVDVSCLVGSGATGESHRQCAQVCADAGLPLAILGSDGNIYMPLADAPGHGQNARLREHVEHRVRVTGQVIRNHGVRGIKIQSIEAAS